MNDGINYADHSLLCMDSRWMMFLNTFYYQQQRSRYVFWENHV